MKARRINYLTSNDLKFKLAKNYFDRLEGFELVQYSFEVPEMQDETCEEVARQAAVFAAQKIGEPCIKLDVGFFISALGGFPGPFVKYANNWLSEDNFLAMLHDSPDRSAYFLDATAIGFPDGSSKVISKKYTGKIAQAGEYKSSDWPANSLFIPDGYATALGSMTDKEHEDYWGDGSWPEVVRYLEGLHATVRG